jgi:hypothetical protein
VADRLGFDRFLRISIGVTGDTVARVIIDVSEIGHNWKDFVYQSVGGTGIVM